MGSSDPQRTGSRTVFHDDAYGNKDTNYDGYSPGFPKTLDLRYEGDLKFKGGDKMSKVVGPVEPGDMVMRASEVPVGAAALLNKMANKTAGMYKLPEQDKDMPAFMKAASKNLAQSDMTGMMAGELLRQGFDPSMIRSLDRDGIIKLYEQTFGSERDAEEMAKGPDPSDFRTILRLLQEGFSMEDIQSLMSDNEEQQAKIMFPGNFTERGQNVKVLPANLKTNPDVPETSLAYITDEEAQMLKMLNPGTPHEGPEGIPTYDSLDYVAAPSTPKPKGATQSSFDAVAQGGGTQEQQDFVQQFQDSAQSATPGQSYMDAVQADIDQGAPSASIEKAIQETGARTGIRDADDTSMGNLQLANFAKNILSSDDPKAALLASDQYKDINELMSAFEPLTGNIGLDDLNLIGLFKGLTSGGLGKDEKDRMFRDEDETELTREGFMKKLDEIKGGRDTFFNLIKRFDPKNFYKVVGMPQTSGAIEDLAKNKMLSGDDLRQIAKDKGKDSKEYKDAIRFNRQIDEARMLTNKKNDGQKSAQGGGGGGGSAAADTPADDMPEPDERAGQFNVGGTMPYKDDVRTAGVEMDVPIGRRFNIDREGKFREPTGMDLNEALKYAMMGGYQQLEPFQEYLKRRKKFLGEEDPRYFDEDGNVIYGGVA